MRDAAKFVSEKLKGRPLVVAEVGVQRAFNATAMLEGLNIERLYLIDPYKPYVDGTFVFSRKVQENVYSIMFRNVEKYLDKVTLISRESMFASTLFKDGFFDFVYLDGWHQYPAVKKDIEVWWPKVKVGGVLGGHDIGHVEFPGVARAVEQFSKKINQPFKAVGDSDWYIEKEK